MLDKPARKQHCWECRRRNLVCDSAKPQCNRCTKDKVDCPGYGDTKPQSLRWLVPGQVYSRRRRKAQATGDLTIELRDAVRYFNKTIYSDLSPILTLCNVPGIYRLTTAHIALAESLPDYLSTSFICTVLAYQLHRETNGRERRKELLQTFYSCRGQVITSLQADTKAEAQTRYEMLLVGMMTLLLIDCQLGDGSLWRVHLDAIRALLPAHGGLSKLAASPTMFSFLNTYILTGVFGNTTSPAAEIFDPQSHVDYVEFMHSRPELLGATSLSCPSSLFLGLIKINQLRHTSTKSSMAVPSSSLQTRSAVVLDDILQFPPSQWVQQRPTMRDTWEILAQIYSAAVTIFCIRSLQSANILPDTAIYTTLCQQHASALRNVLSTALATACTRRLSLWPLLVLGFESVHTHAVPAQDFVEKELENMSRYMGTAVPLTGRDVLVRFWASGSVRWDDCFEQPFLSVAQLAVDRQHIRPE